MFADKTYQVALLISAITHGLILYQVSSLNTLPAEKNKQKVEISYIKIAQDLTSHPKINTIKKEPLTNLPPKISSGIKPPPPFMNKENMFRPASNNILSDAALTKPALMKPDVIAVKKKITLPALDIEKINNPSYIGYYQIVREKIRRAAYQNYSRTETGEVYLTFIISAEGKLKEVRFVNEKSSGNQYLREIALRSIREASPFPVFPKELDYPQLSFNVVISFEIEQ